MSGQLTFDRVAAAYDDFMGRWTRLFMPALLRAAALVPGQHVLDLATGTGESALMAADVAGPASRVVGVDLSLAMLRGARAKLGARPIRLAAMDGHTLACRDHAFDAVICQLGLMFFPNPLAALGEARRVLRPRGRFAALVWSRAERVPWFGTLAQELVAHLPARRAEVFQSVSLGDPERLRGLVAEAGFSDVTLATETQNFRFESFDAYWAQMEAGAIRIGLMLRDLPDDTRRAIREAVATRLAPFQSRGRLALPTEAFLVSGSK